MQSIMGMVAGSVMIIIGVILVTTLTTAINSSITPANVITMVNLLPIALVGIGILVMFVSALSWGK